MPSPDVPRGQSPLRAADDATRRVPSTGLSIALHDLGGDEGAEPVLLVHATGFHGRVWAPCAGHLPWRCWAPDLRGHGASPLPPEAFTDLEPDPAWLAWERMTDDVLAVVDALHGAGAPEGLRAAGHSMGGAVLLRAEQRRPGTFRALYVYEPIVLPSEALAARPENPLAAGARRRRRTFESIDAAIANYGAKPPLDTFDPAALDAYVRHGFHPEADGSVSLDCTPEVEATVFAEAMRQQIDTGLGQVACPVTVARGRVDEHSMPASLAPGIAAALPRGELADHPRLGHFGPLEDPKGIAAEITEHLGRAS